MKKRIHLPRCLCSNCTFLPNKEQNGKCNAKYKLRFNIICYNMWIWGHGEQVEKQKSSISLSENLLLKVRTFSWQLKKEVQESGARLAKRLQFSLFTDSLLEMTTNPLTHYLSRVYTRINNWVGYWKGV